MQNGDSNSRPVNGGPAICFGKWTFLPKAGVLWSNGEETALPRRVAALLERLLETPGEIVPKEELIGRVWPDTAVSDHSLSEAVRALRRVLGDDPKDPTYVQTMPRRGYRFVAEVTEEEAPVNGVVIAAGVTRLDTARSSHLPDIRPEALANPAWGLALAAALLLAGAVWLWAGSTTPATDSGLGIRLLSSTTSGDPGIGVIPDLSPDGRWLAYASDRLGIRRRNLETGEDFALHEPSDENRGRVRNEQRVWSSDGTQIAFLWRDESVDPDGWQVRIAEVPSGEWRTVYETNRESLALHDWSIDDHLFLRETPLDAEGRAIRDTSARYAQLSLAEGSLMHFVDLTGPDYGARYSPDGTWVAYAIGGPNGTTIHIDSRDRASQRIVTPAETNDASPVWSPDGRHLAFERRRQSSTDIMVVTVDDGAIAGPWLLHSNARPLVLVDWRAGTGIVFGERFTRRTLNRLPVNLTNLTGLGEPQAVSESFAGELDGDYLPSASGDRFVTWDRAGGRRQARLLTVGRSQPLPIPTDYRFARFVGWGPEDEWILGIARRADAPRFFFRLDPASGRISEGTQLDDETLDVLGSDLSADGRWLSMQRGLRTPADDLDLVAVDTETGQIQDLGVSGVNFRTSWAPDSSRIAVIRTPREEPQRLLVVSRDSDEPTVSRTLTDGWGLDPTWSPDGAWIALTMEPDDDNVDIVVFPGGDGPRRQLARYGPHEPQPGTLHWSRDGNVIFAMFAVGVEQLWGIDNVDAYLEAEARRAAVVAAR